MFEYRTLILVWIRFKFVFSGLEILNPFGYFENSGSYLNRFFGTDSDLMLGFRYYAKS